MTRPARLPGDLDIVIVGAPLTFTPCWVVYPATVRGQPAIAARLMPELCATAPQAERLTREWSLDLATVPDRVLNPAFVTEVEALGAALQEALGALPPPAIPLSGDGALGYSVTAKSYWIAYAVEPGAFRDSARAGTPFAVRSLGLLASLDTLHQRGIWHGDIAPSLVLADGALLLPGGSLRALARDDQHAWLVTRAGYSPPELYDLSQASAVGPWTDIYMLSATLYALATGAPPPSPRDRPRDPQAFRAEVVATLSQAPDHAPFAGAIAAGLTLRTGERPQTVEAWRALIDDAALAQVLAALEPEPEPATPTDLASDADDKTPKDGGPAETIVVPGTDRLHRDSAVSETSSPSPVTDIGSKIRMSISFNPPTAAVANNATNAERPPDTDGGETGDTDGGQRQRFEYRRAWIMVVAVIVVGGAALIWSAQQSTSPPGPIEGTPTPIVEASPSPVATPTPTAQPTPISTPTTEPVPPAPPLPLTALEGRWRRGDSAACDTTISAGADQLNVGIGATRYTHRVTGRDGETLRTRMTGDAEGDFTVRAENGGNQLTMTLVGGGSEAWTKCGLSASAPGDAATARRKRD